MKHHYPDDVATLVSLGHLYVATQQYARAIETFNTAILIHPDNFATPDESLEQLLADGAFSEALDQIELLLADEPQRADLIARGADMLIMMGETTDAIARYQQALRICPSYLEATIKLGTAYLKMDAQQLAAQQFNAAVEINDTIVEAYVGLAAAQKLAGSRDQALNTLSLAAAIQPNSAFLFNETAKLILKAALDNDLVAPSQDDASSSGVLPVILDHERDDRTTGQNLDDLVLAAHQSHLAACQNNPDLYYRLGILHMNAGRHQDAADCFRAAIQINPAFARAATKLAVCLFEIGRLDDALAVITPAGICDSATLELYYQTALLYCDRVKFASSLINLKKHLESNLGPDVDLPSNISVILQNMGLSDSVGLMWENLCQTAGHASGAEMPTDPQSLE